MNIGAFSVLDLVLFVAVVIISFVIGLYHGTCGKKQASNKEYFTGNRSLRTVPVAISMLVSFVSAILVLGTPAEIYTRSTLLVTKVFGYIIAVVLTIILFVPLFHPLHITSAFEYLDKRFKSLAVRRMGTAMMIAGTVFYMGLVMYTPSTALEAVSGVPLYVSVGICAGVSSIYTAIGGIKGVVYTDVFQAFVLVAGMLAIVIAGSINAGGLSRVWTIGTNAGKVEFFNWSVDPTERLTSWSLLIGGTFYFLNIFGLGQTSLQRYCSLPTLKQAQRSLLLNIPALLVLNALASLTGLVIFAYYVQQQCDPLGAKVISNANQLVPYFVFDVLRYPGLPGLFLSVLFSGALSSMSSCLNCVAAVTWQDFCSFCFVNRSQNFQTAFTKCLVVAYGFVAMFVSLAAENIGGHVLWASLSFTGATSGPSLGMFLLGAFVPFANSKGALIGCLASFAFSLWISLGAFITRPHRNRPPSFSSNCSSNFSTISTTITNASTVSTNPASSVFHGLYSISFLWYPLIGAAVTIVIGIIVSLLTGRQKEVSVDLIVKPMRRFCGNKNSKNSKISPADDEELDLPFVSEVT